MENLLWFSIFVAFALGVYVTFRAAVEADDNLCRRAYADGFRQAMKLIHERAEQLEEIYADEDD